MRFAFLLMTAALPAAAVAKPNPECRHPQASVAPATGEAAKPRKLNELPPATPYMAVLRTVRGCPAPLTMTEYRTGKRR